MFVLVNTINLIFGTPVCFYSNKDGHLVKPPDKEKMLELQADFRAWERVSDIFLQ